MKYICLASFIHDWEDTRPQPFGNPERELKDCPDHSPHESEGVDHREMQEMGEA